MRFVFVFYVGERKREKNEKNGKGKLQKKQKIGVFGMVVNKKDIFAEMALKKGKQYLCSEGKKSAHFRCNYLFWENGPFFSPIQSRQTLQKSGFPSKGGFTIWKKKAKIYPK